MGANLIYQKKKVTYSEWTKAKLVTRQCFKLSKTKVTMDHITNGTMLLAFKEAIKRITPSRSDKPHSEPVERNLSANESRPSFFMQYYADLYSQTDTIPLQYEGNSTLPLNFRTFGHPDWKNWRKIWNAPTIKIDHYLIPEPIVEDEIRSAIFRLHLSCSYIHAIHKRLTIQQGSTISFQGFDDTHVRHIVEWCHWIDEHDAYLKVVGVDSSGRPFPYNDPEFPSFILVVPSHFSQVPFPPALSSILAAATETQDRPFCWICNQ